MAFYRTVDFYEMSEEDVQHKAENLIARWFNKAPSPMAMASHVAVDWTNVDRPAVVGAALLLRYETGPHLDLLFVRPEWQRQGVASALVSRVINTLAEQNEARLSSFYDIGNVQSEAWHRKFGFVEQPDLQVARLRWRALSHEIWRQEQLGEISQSESAELKRIANAAKARVQQLEAIHDRDGFQAVAPILRFR